MGDWETRTKQWSTCFAVVVVAVMFPVKSNLTNGFLLSFFTFLLFAPVLFLFMI